MNAFFFRVNVTFYDAVNMIHDVITTPDPFPYTAKFMFIGVRHNKTQQTSSKDFGIEPTTSRSLGGLSNHQAIAAVT